MNQIWLSEDLVMNPDRILSGHHQVFFCIGTLKKQVVIINKTYINESKQRAQLLIKWLLDTVTQKHNAPARELRSRSRLLKQPAIGEASPKSIINKNNKNRSNKNEELKTSKSQIGISITKAISEIHKPVSSHEIINNPILDWHWTKAIKEELQNLRPSKQRVWGVTT